MEIMEYSDRCKVCLIPLFSLMSDNLLSHERDCVKSKIPKRACSKGINCQATLPSHYKNFSHDVLAEFLSTVNCKIQQTDCTKNVSMRMVKTESQVSQQAEQLKSTSITVKSETKQAMCVKRSLTFVDFDHHESKKRKFHPAKTVTKLKYKSQLQKLDSDTQVSPKTYSSAINNPKQSFSSTTHGDRSCNEDIDIEFENIICDVDINSWSVNDFMDEDTLPLENNVNQEDTLLFENTPLLCSLSDQMCAGKFEHCLKNFNDNFDEEKTISERVPTLHGHNDVCDNINESDNTQKCKIQSNKLKTAKTFSPKKQVAITSYFGGNSVLKFVEEKPNPKSPRAKSQVKKVEPDYSNELTSTVSHEPKRRQWSCPFYKKIPGTTFAVDAFCYGKVPGVNHYFLSHFHYDHYRGLTKKFQGNIYCNSITGKLITLKLGIPYASLNILPMEKSTIIDEVDVKLLDANHCPGSVMFLFQTSTGQTVLHTGDFRAHHKMESYPDLLHRKIDELYLDTTYLDPMYTFPLQEDIIKFVVSLSYQSFSRNSKTLFVCGSYTIGKERVFISVAEKLNCKIWASNDKLRIYGCIENSSLETRLSRNPNFAQIHVLSMNQLNFKALQEHLNKFSGIFNNVIAIKPTGWEYRAGSNISTLANIKPKTSGAVSIYGIPYSEHSSFNELKAFVKFLRPKKVIPTVSVGNPKKRNEMQSILKSWQK